MTFLLLNQLDKPHAVAGCALAVSLCCWKGRTLTLSSTARDVTIMFHLMMLLRTGLYKTNSKRPCFPALTPHARGLDPILITEYSIIINYYSPDNDISIQNNYVFSICA